MNIILIFIIGVSLSMDAFSLSLAYGTLSFNKKEIKELSIIVGLYHFIMPIIGMNLGKYIIRIIKINPNIITSIIFLFIGTNMIIDIKKTKNKIIKLKLGEMILFGFAVSIDSFSIGIGLNNISNNFIICSIIFSLTSYTFTYMGLILGKKISSIIGNIAMILGGFTLIFLGIIYII